MREHAFRCSAAAQKDKSTISQHNSAVHQVRCREDNVRSSPRRWPVAMQHRDVGGNLYRIGIMSES